MSLFLKPHSDYWFKELEKQNPHQASHTRKIISLAGSSEVCSICGDRNANDYKLESNQRISGALVTLKLCEDCLIARNMGGEKFVLLFNKYT